jgi:hypothetical protein
MDFYIDQVTFTNPVVTVNSAPFQSWPLEQSGTEGKSIRNQTAFVTTEVNALDLFAITKGLFAQTTPPMQQSVPPIEKTLTLKESVHPQNVTADMATTNIEIDQIAKQRVRLMAAKYATGVQSTEILARLEILNNRLSEQAPLVSKEQVTALEDANAQLVRISLAREKRAKRFGIPFKL